MRGDRPPVFDKSLVSHWFTRMRGDRPSSHLTLLLRVGLPRMRGDRPGRWVPISTDRRLPHEDRPFHVLTPLYFCVYPACGSTHYG